MTPQEAAEQYAIKHDHHARYDKGAFLAGQQWQSEQDNQALSSALEEIEKLNDEFSGAKDYIVAITKDHEKEIAELHAKVKELEKLISIDSVWTLLRYGYKSPSSSGVDDCEDDDYMDLYKLSTDLKQANRLASESNPEPDSANLPPESAS